MPSTGTPCVHTAAGARGVSPSVTLLGPPDKTMPFGANSRMNVSLTSYGWISQYTCVSRRRRAMSCVYCAPKSRIRILECDDAAKASETNFVIRNFPAAPAFHEIGVCPHLLLDPIV